MINWSIFVASWPSVSRLENGVLALGTGIRLWDCEYPFEAGLISRWTSMGYPMKKQMKIKLAFLYWEIMCRCATPTFTDNSRTRAPIKYG
jgi:hypothetical protein